MAQPDGTQKDFDPNHIGQRSRDFYRRHEQAADLQVLASLSGEILDSSRAVTISLRQ